MKNLYSTLVLSLLLSMIIINNCHSEQESNQAKQNNSIQLKTNTNAHNAEELTTYEQKSKEKQDSYKVDKPLVFGYDFFKSAESDNLKDVSTGILPDYILKPRDEININIWGDLNLHYTLVLDNDMSITIPEIGNVSLGGLAYKEAKTKILHQLSKTYSFYIDVANPGTGKAPVDISLSKAVGIHVFVTGAILNPGDITCKGSDSSIFGVIRKAGGITKHGSLRNIKLIKSNGKEINFDLYDFLINGKLSSELKYLNDGDIVYVPLISRQVTVMGAVKRPGVFELATNDKLINLMRIAGGLMPDAIPELKIARIVKGSAAGKILDINLSSQENFELCEGDIVRAVVSQNNSITGNISISGAVKFPGEYRYISEEKITEFLLRAGGLNKSAFPAGSKLVRNGLSHIISLDKAVEAPGSESDFTLFPNDHISVPMFSNFVMIKGAVEKPLAIPYKKGQDASYYIKNAGGYKDNADKGAIQIINPNGSIADAFPGSWVTSNPEVPAGSTINVQEK